ncbi:hypothetical protein TthAA37_24220 (plasmid) [Thermus thermophilus]|uniref:hypothetical protein n=1 Tax=Thermus thermophilus TaxID=274 RepID=UPI001C78F1C1|nr:hypothetical protein [Thermus thermophilus]BCZ90603.1 hypothetical protein TthAA22_24080 [Thermus thermophilus]BCZ93233.1 hypothetical protein TthAA37_24220 [Thermus thermophilus]
MEEKVLIFKDTRHQEAFRKALEKASLSRAVIRPDHGWPKPALRVRGVSPSHVLAAALWAGFEPEVVLE